MPGSCCLLCLMSVDNASTAPFIRKQYPVLAEGWVVATNPSTKKGMEYHVTPALMAEAAANTRRMGGCPIDVNHDRVARPGLFLPNTDMRRSEAGRLWMDADVLVADPTLAPGAENGDYPAMSVDIDHDAAKGGFYFRYASLVSKDQQPAIVGMPPLHQHGDQIGQYTAPVVVQCSQAALSALGIAQETPQMPENPPGNPPAPAPEQPSVAALLASPEAQTLIQNTVNAALQPVIAENADLKAQLETVQGSLKTTAWAQKVAGVKSRLGTLSRQGKVTPAQLSVPGICEALAALIPDQIVAVQLTSPDGGAMLKDGKAVEVNPVEALFAFLESAPTAINFDPRLVPSIAQIGEAAPPPLLDVDPTSPYFTALGQTPEQIADFTAKRGQFIQTPDLDRIDRKGGEA